MIWTEEQKQILRDYAGKKCAREIAAMVGHTRWATMAKIASMGLKGFRPGPVPKITDAQLEALRNVKPGTLVRQFAREHGLSTSCIYLWAERLGVTFSGYGWWTDADEEKLRGMAGKSTFAEAAEKLNRTARAVEYKSKRLGIKMRRQTRPDAKPATPPKTKKVAKPKPMAVVRPRKTVEISGLEWCPVHRCPVSNWQQHAERMGCRRSA